MKPCTRTMFGTMTQNDPSRDPKTYLCLSQVQKLSQMIQKDPSRGPRSYSTCAGATYEILAQWLKITPLVAQITCGLLGIMTQNDPTNGPTILLVLELRTRVWLNGQNE